jgi:hypothetical protein
MADFVLVRVWTFWLYRYSLGIAFLFLQPQTLDLWEQYYNAGKSELWYTPTEQRLASQQRHSNRLFSWHCRPPPASGVPYATILAATHLRLSQRLPGVACIPQGSGLLHCCTTLYQLPRLRRMVMNAKSYEVRKRMWPFWRDIFTFT